MVTDQGDYLYHIDPIGDLPNEEAEKRKAAIKHHSAAALKSPSSMQRTSTFQPRIYCARTIRDCHNERQKELVETASGEITTVMCDSGHSPFLSQPKLVVEVIRKAAGERI
jgi:hypothetical protein